MKRNHFLVATALLASLGIAFVGGCSFDDHDKDHDRDRDADVHHDRDLDKDWPSRIPRDARVLEEGRGDISARAPSDGRIYVYDTDSNELVYSSAVDRDDRINVKPDDDRVQLNGRTVFDQNLERKHEHRIYFGQSDRRDRD